MRIAPDRFWKRPVTLAVEWHDSMWCPAIVTRTLRRPAVTKPLLVPPILAHPVRQTIFTKSMKNPLTPLRRQRRQQHRRQNGDDGDDDEQFDKGEGRTLAAAKK